MDKYKNYFTSREVKFENLKVGIPFEINPIINKLPHNANILDIGCGPCTLLLGEQGIYKFTRY